MEEGKTLYISDLDGTLLNKDAALSEYTKSTLNKIISRGIHFTVASGRTTDGVEQIMSGVELNVPIASFNGVVLYDTRQKRHVKVCRLSIGAVKNIIDVLKSHGAPALMYELKDDALIAYYESLEDQAIRSYVENRTARFNSTFCQIQDLGGLAPDHVMYFTLMGTYELINSIYDTLKSFPDIHASLLKGSENWWLEIFSAEASKENAVAFFRETYGYKKIIGFGDNLNDLPLFKACDVRVATKNALDELKAAADYICESHDEDGVVKWIMHQI